MALELKQQIKMAQQLVITPQLQQAIKLLQLTRVELQDLVQQEMTENPMLETRDNEADREADRSSQSHGEQVEAAKNAASQTGEIAEVGGKSGDMNEPNNFDWENYLGIYNSPWPTTAPPPASELPSFENSMGSMETLNEHLIWQLHLSNLSDAEMRIGERIIGNINDDGYLNTELETIAENESTDVEHVEACLRKIQRFDPPGVGARDLQECLKLQVALIGGKDEQLLYRVIEEHMKELERHHFSQIARKLRVAPDHARALAQVIQGLEPKPGRPFQANNAQYITPDVYVQHHKGDYEVLLNDEGMPRLQISRFYRSALQSGSEVRADAKEYMQDKLRSAMWLIKSIHQRQQTLYKVTSSIVKFQREFFDKGIDHLKPMILRDVAEDIEMHESTVSRVTTNKYMHTPRGIFELKYFFNSGVQKSEGSDVAAEAVKQKIAGYIKNEDAKKPLSDQSIVTMLKADGIKIARRTVAKYRESLAIPPSSQRRRME